MRKLLGTAAVTVLGLAAVFTGGGRVSAMVDGTPDTAHPMVGSFWIQDPASGNYYGICTGSFVSPTVFVTASHCVSYPVSIGAKSFISMNPIASPNGPRPADAIPATAHLNPLYRTAKGTDLYNHDVSVLSVAPSDAYTGPLAKLPTAGLLDSLKKSKQLDSFTVVGYGSSSMVVVPRVGPTFPDTAGRLSAVLGFHALGASVLHEDQRSNAGWGGACYGDSGGPSFVGTSDVIVGVTSTGDIPCYATNTAYRLDTADARAFLGQFVALP